MYLENNNGIKAKTKTPGVGEKSINNEATKDEMNNPPFSYEGFINCFFVKSSSSLCEFEKLAARDKLENVFITRTENMN